MYFQVRLEESISQQNKQTAHEQAAAHEDESMEYENTRTPSPPPFNPITWVKAPGVDAIEVD